MNKIISQFKIYRLFGSMNVCLKFDETENIYIGENGLGKTTILSTIFYTLTKRFSELTKVEFEKIEIIFGDSESYEFTADDIKQYYFLKRRNPRNRRINSHFKKIINNYLDEITKLATLKAQYTHRELLDTEFFTSLCEKISSETGLPKVYLEKNLYEFTRTIDLNVNAISKLENRLDELLINNEILYFPTFRRIEEDITKLKGFTEVDNDDDDDDDFDDNFHNNIEIVFPKLSEDAFSNKGELIKFGMSDVETTIDELLQIIRKTSINSFNQMTAILLKQYVKNEISNNKDEKINLNNLKISLDRVGSEIEVSYKEIIIRLVESEEIYSQKNSYLLNFIKNLLASHEQLRTIDNRIEKFVKVCNKYLVNKKYHYDASNVTLQIINNHYNKEIPLRKLSSGEKQIISTFSKIYLEHKKNYIILFDEPELSLSMKWQEQYIPDIIQSGNCSLLLCVTHSPFIFRDERLFDISKEILDEIELIDSTDWNFDSELKSDTDAGEVDF
ncbi:AAA family ATPase [Bacillus altitudinis]|uniref:AAA family ATPase n=1 Tax=Bacillus altitudinis TaxID=293387 RepID=UPI0013C832A5|nr:AAA family ATPase [Bacillus altitudinis]NEU52707.1 AAA family ATPase [Bacillus altitudinis]